MADKDDGILLIVLVAYLKDSNGPRFLVHVSSQKRYATLIPNDNYSVMHDIGPEEDDENILQIMGKYNFLPFVERQPVFSTKQKLDEWIKDQFVRGWPDLR